MIVRNECHSAFFFFVKAEQSYDLLFFSTTKIYAVLSTTKAVITLYLSVHDHSD